MIHCLQRYGTPAYQKRVLIMISCSLQLLLWGQVLFHILPRQRKAPRKDLEPFCPTPAYQAQPQNSTFLIQRVVRKKCWNAALLSHASAAARMHEDISCNTATHNKVHSTQKVALLAARGLRPRSFGKPPSGLKRWNFPVEVFS